MLKKNTPTDTTRKGGGIIVYIKSGLSPYITVLHNFCKNDPDSEELWLTISKPGCKKKIIGVVYRPPSGLLTNFVSCLDSTLDFLLGKGNPNEKEIYIIGDFNIDYSKSKRDQNKTKLKDLELKYNFRQIIKKPTRISKTCKSVIDLIFTSLSQELISESGTLEICISDHVPIFMTRKKKREQHPKKTITVRSTHLYTVESFSCILLDDPRWEIFWDGTLDINSMWTVMLKIFTDSLNIICPLKRIRVRTDQPCWFDGELRKSIRDKNRQYQKACENNTSLEWDNLKVLKRRVRSLIIHKKRNFIMQKLNENRYAPKKFWKEIQKNLHFGKDVGQNAPISVKDLSGRLLVGKEASEPMNKYYAQVGSALAEKFNSTWLPPTIVHPLTYVPNMSFRFVGIKEVQSLINGLNSDKSSQVEGITTNYLKDALNTMILEFTHLINQCLDQFVMPREWSIGTITPIPKNGLSHSMSDYRPISVLPSPSKIIERAVYNQLVYHLESHGLLDSRQHGFRKDHSTCSAIFELIQYLYNNLDNRKYISCVFIDYSKAFDTIDHEILCKKLRHYGLGKGVLAWCKDYLSYRQQCVKIDGKTSIAEPVSYGVPQGSILGPLFFIIYVNDLMMLFDRNNVQILLYADDTVVYFADSNANVASKTIEEALTKINNWCALNKLTINIKKTKHMLVSPRNVIYQVPTCNIKMGCSILENVISYNYLGVVIDNLLIFDDFLSQKCNKINMRLYQLMKMRKFITSKIACTMYKQVILPILDYADFLIDCGSAYYIKKLNSLHEKAIRLIDCKKHVNIEVDELGKVYKLQVPKYRRNEHHCAVMYRMSKQGGTLDNYRPPIRLRNRNKIKFKSSKRNLEGVLKSPLYRGIKLWDRIPENIQRSVTKVKFKRELKKLVLN